MDTTARPLSSIGIDIGKEVFHVVGFGTDGKIAFRRKIKRLALVETFRRLPPSVVGMEACLSAHFVSRTLRQLGHQPRIIPAIYVKPFVKGQKNDYNDAEARIMMTKEYRDGLQDLPCRRVRGHRQAPDAAPAPCRPLRLWKHQIGSECRGAALARGGPGRGRRLRRVGAVTRRRIGAPGCRDPSAHRPPEGS